MSSRSSRRISRPFRPRFRSHRGTLYATAVGRRDTDAGLKLLADAERSPVDAFIRPSSPRSPTTARTFTGFAARWRETERLARITETANVDVLSVRGTQLRGFVAMAQGRFADALGLFESARRAYGRCREHDTNSQWSSCNRSVPSNKRSAAIRFRHTLCSSWTHDPTRRVGLEPRAAGASALRRRRRLFALDGDAARATRKRAKPTLGAHRRMARARPLVPRRDRGGIRGAAAAQTFAVEARALASRVDWGPAFDDQRFALLLLAEVFSSFDPAGASEILAAFDAIESPLAVTRVLYRGGADPRQIRGWNAFVRANGRAVSEGNSRRPPPLYAAALDAFRSCGYRWREVATLAALADLPPAVRVDGVAAPLDEAVALVTQHFPKAFLARRFAGWTRVYVDARTRTLSPAQREVIAGCSRGARRAGSPRSKGAATRRSARTFVPCTARSARGRGTN